MSHGVSHGVSHGAFHVSRPWDTWPMCPGTVSHKRSQPVITDETPGRGWLKRDVIKIILGIRFVAAPTDVVIIEALLGERFLDSAGDVGMAATVAW